MKGLAERTDRTDNPKQQLSVVDAGLGCSARLVQATAKASGEAEGAKHKGGGRRYAESPAGAVGDGRCAQNYSKINIENYSTQF